MPEELGQCHEAVREFLSRGDPLANPSADAVFHKHVKDTESRLQKSDFVRSCTYFLVRADLFEEALEEPMLRVALFKLVLSIVGYHTRVESHLKQAFRMEKTCLKTELINEAWNHGAIGRILVKEYVTDVEATATEACLIAALWGCTTLGNARRGLANGLPIESQVKCGINELVKFLAISRMRKPESKRLTRSLNV